MTLKVHLVVTYVQDSGVLQSLTNDVHLSDACCVSLQFFCCCLQLVNIASDRFNAIVGCLNAVTRVNHLCVHGVQLVIAVCQVLSASHTFYDNFICTISNWSLTDWHKTNKHVKCLMSSSMFNVNSSMSSSQYIILYVRRDKFCQN